MANVFTSQILMDGEQKVVVHCVGTLDTSDLAATTILNMTTLKATNPLCPLRCDSPTGPLHSANTSEPIPRDLPLHELWFEISSLLRKSLHCLQYSRKLPNLAPHRSRHLFVLPLRNLQHLEPCCDAVRLVESLPSA